MSSISKELIERFKASGIPIPRELEIGIVDAVLEIEKKITTEQKTGTIKEILQAMYKKDPSHRIKIKTSLMFDDRVVHSENLKDNNNNDPSTMLMANYLDNKARSGEHKLEKWQWQEATVWGGSRKWPIKWAISRILEFISTELSVEEYK